MAVQITNFLLYQIGWFAIVFGAVWNSAAWGAGTALVLVVIHLLLAEDRRDSLLLCGAAAVTGILVELALKTSGVYRLASDTQTTFPPYWILVMWVQFATLFPYCLRWMSGRYVLAAVLGLSGGPLAFLGGERLGAVTFPPPRFVHLLYVGVLWAIATPVLLVICDRLFGKSRVHAGYRGPFRVLQ